MKLWLSQIIVQSETYWGAFLEPNVLQIYHSVYRKVYILEIFHGFAFNHKIKSAKVSKLHFGAGIHHPYLAPVTYGLQLFAVDYNTSNTWIRRKSSAVAAAHRVILVKLCFARV